MIQARTAVLIAVVLLSLGGAAAAQPPIPRLTGPVNDFANVIDRQSGKKAASFVRPGSFPGQFNQPHGIAVDSKGNLYVAENRGKRIHKFRPVTC